MAVVKGDYERVQYACDEYSTGYADDAEGMPCDTGGVTGGERAGHECSPWELER